MYNLCCSSEVMAFALPLLLLCGEICIIIHILYDKRWFYGAAKRVRKEKVTVSVCKTNHNVQNKPATQTGRTEHDQVTAKHLNKIQRRSPEHTVPLVMFLFMFFFFSFEPFEASQLSVLK